MRIIAGSAKGRRFDAPEGKNTRPTLDRVKEAMFGMIQFDIEGRRVLDLFSGSGNLGLEALSRGAESVVFCDSDRKAAELVRRNCALLGFEGRGEVFCCDCFLLISQLAHEGRAFSLVLLDPPYESGLTVRVLGEMAERGLMADGCIILAEHAWRFPVALDMPCFTVGKPHKYGDAAVTKIVYHAEER